MLQNIKKQKMMVSTTCVDMIALTLFKASLSFLYSDR